MGPSKLFVADYIAVPEPPKPKSNLTATRILGEFQEFLEPGETPFTETLPSRRMPATPDFCKKEKKQTVGPFIYWYERLLDIIADVSPKYSEEDWVEESESLTDLRKLAFEIGRYSYREIPNEAYNEKECLEWKEENMKHFTKVEWGTSDLTEVDESVIITPDGPRVVDERSEGE